MGFLRGKRYMIHDRDPLFTEAFRTILSATGITCLKLPPQSPNLNAVAERFVLSMKSECLDKLVPLGERRAPSQGLRECGHPGHGKSARRGLPDRDRRTRTAAALDGGRAAPIE